MANVLNGYGGQFFPDQNVTAKDLNMIGYSNTKAFRDYLKAFMANAGVVSSDLTTDNSLKVVTADGTSFEVNAGAAVDSEGRIMNVPSSTTASGSAGDDPLYRPAQPSRTNLSTGITSPGTYYVNLVYTPMYDSVQYDDSGNSFNTRVYDSYTISVDATRTTAGITLASMILNASGSILQDSSGTGYYSTSNSTWYAIYDDRPVFQVEDGRIGTIEDLTTVHETDLTEQLEKSVGFLFPQDGHTFSATIPRNATIETFTIMCQGSSGGVTVHLYSGSSAYEADQNLIANVSTTPPTVYFDGWTSQTLNLLYYDGHTLRIVIASAGASITECTASIVYSRRR
ncbi:hypothetical protein LCGC14_1316730 [marine sediment metagenome]|uniref:Uncharacterized protein n=1 Tax=marine sediment metagenome TaxID=412755 RepID=A0A0F9KKP6_9ZZZZ